MAKGEEEEEGEEDEDEDEDGEDEEDERDAKIVKLKRQVYETAADLYLERSMREFIMTSRGLAKAKPTSFKLPGAGTSANATSKASGPAVSILNYLWPWGRKSAEDDEDAEDSGDAGTDASGGDNDEEDAIPDPIPRRRKTMAGKTSRKVRPA